MDSEKLDKKIQEMFEQGMTDNEILNIIVTEQEEQLTFMELRIKRAEYEVEHPESIEQEEDDEPVEEETAEDKNTIIKIDSIKKPGTLLSGTANLPSGAKAVWMLDQTGRINIQPDGDKEPTQEDLKIFQEEFRKEIQKSGGLI